ncbi:hypothetical protein N657DRAFT_318194 [Parathielavia appendiculata]|uniref:Secreted protein n=1 Tax=Parathielavia appendiculata TaxID=2587402 RepID=A0AAN6TRR8_9PEZI|nr:hypothetical protein N657DRAFT_318194 [Parathielavia appendiculata]
MYFATIFTASTSSITILAILIHLPCSKVLVCDSQTQNKRKKKVVVDLAFGKHSSCLCLIWETPRQASSLHLSPPKRGSHLRPEQPESQPVGHVWNEKTSSHLSACEMVV